MAQIIKRIKHHYRPGYSGHSATDKQDLAEIIIFSTPIRINELMNQLHISQRPLEKRFRLAVGTSPKKFDSIVRLKNVVKGYNATSLLTDLGYEAGFYDQAHFIKEFKTFTGETPEKFFSNKK